MYKKVVPSGTVDNTIFVAVEVSGKSWVVAISRPDQPGQQPSLHKLAAKEDKLPALMRKVEGALGEFKSKTGGDARVLLTYEAGYEAFWLARCLALEEAVPIDVVVCDPASLQIDRRARHVKTDKCDARMMIRALKAWEGGDVSALSAVRIPTLEEEDRRRLLRDRDRLVQERVRLTNTILSLLRTQGISDLDPLKQSFVADLAAARTPFGTQLLDGLRDSIMRAHERLHVVVAQIRKVEAERHERVKASKVAAEAETEPEPDSASANLSSPDNPAMGRLTGLKGIGPNDAVLLATEVLCRDFRNRRELAAWAGLAPVPWASGSVDRTQGISKAGPPRVRKHLVQMAWRWIYWQKESELTKWFYEYCKARDGRSRRRGIVAVARKLLVALWRYATTGVVPAGAVIAP